MFERRRQKGEGRIGCILWLTLLAVGALIGYKAIPVKLATSELYDFMVEQAKWAASNPPARIKRHILEKANELELPVDPKQVTVERYGDHIRMKAFFTVPLDFPGYVYYWDFKLEVDRPIFIF